MHVTVVMIRIVSDKYEISQLEVMNVTGSFK